MSSHDASSTPPKPEPRLSTAPITLQTTTPDQRQPVWNRAFTPLRMARPAEGGRDAAAGSPYATARPDTASSVGGTPLVISPRAESGVQFNAEVAADPGASADAGAAPVGGTPRFGGPQGARHDSAGWEAAGGRGCTFEGIEEEEEEGEEGGEGGEGAGGAPGPGLGDTVEAAGPPPPPPAGASPPPGAPLDDGYDDMCGE